MSTMSKAH
jgi:hypothetical protein